MARTTITIPQELITDLMELTKRKNKTQAVIFAIEEMIKKQKLEKIKNMAGKMEFDMEAEELRHGDKRLG
ncbi:MAG: DUF2191 domain-containing protein [Chloroflexi bacterium]|nr:DUF2191 domain-containing protein [Chloroflexota bacterium]